MILYRSETVGSKKTKLVLLGRIVDDLVRKSSAEALCKQIEQNLAQPSYSAVCFTTYLASMMLMCRMNLM